MTSRLDRLISLLDTGSTPLIRQTASKQIGDLARRFYTDSSTTTHDTVIQNGQPQSQLQPQPQPKEDDNGLADGWPQIVALLSKLVPFLQSRSMDTRLAAVEAIGNVMAVVPEWIPASELRSRSINMEIPNGEDKNEQSSFEMDDLPDITAFDVFQVLRTRQKLVASSGNEYAKMDKTAPPNEGKRLKSKGKGSKENGGGQSQGRDLLDSLGINSELDDIDVDLELENGNVAASKASAADSAEWRPKKRKMSTPRVSPSPTSTSPAPTPAVPEGQPFPSLPSKNESIVPSPPTNSVIAPEKEKAKLGRPRGSKSNLLTASLVPPPAPASVSSSASTQSSEDIFAGLSGRQILVLKRKIKNGMSQEDAAEEGMKMRLGVGPSTPATPLNEQPSYPVPSTATGTSEAAPNKEWKKGKANKVKVKEEKVKEEVKNDRQSPVKEGRDTTGVKVEETDTDDLQATLRSGGAVQATSSVSKNADPDGLFNASLHDDEWIWKGFADQLTQSLQDPAWETRHGSALALRDLLRIHGKGYGKRSRSSITANARRHETALINLSHRIIETLILDRFGDFIGDQVVAPVREAASQTLASVMKHMSNVSMKHVHEIIQEMIRQEGRTGQGSDSGSEVTSAPYVWEVRHAGLLGLKYEVAVRPDFVTQVEEGEGKLLVNVVEAALLGLADNDDDVRGTSAACLSPIADVLAKELSDNELKNLLRVLWDCFSISHDDLGTSVGSIMELLGKLLTTRRVIDLYASVEAGSDQSITHLIPRLYPYFRHTIAHVRLAVVQSLNILLTADRLPHAWADERLLHLLFRNLVLEERDDIRKATHKTWDAAVDLGRTAAHWIERNALPHLALWLNIAMVPIIDGLTKAVFFEADKAAGKIEESEGHSYDVDKHVLACDLGIVSYETLIRNRVESVAKLAVIGACEQSTATMCTLISGYILSTSAYQLAMIAILAEEWMHQRDLQHPPSTFESAIETIDGLQPIVDLLTKTIETASPPMYYELAKHGAVIQSEASSISLATKKEKAGRKRKLDGEEVPLMSLSEAETFLETFNSPPDMPQSLKDRLASALTSLVRYREERINLDARVLSTTAGALVSMRFTPPRLNPLIQSIMKGIRGEPIVMLQRRAAYNLAVFVKNCLDPASPLPSAPPNKIIGNLATYLCQDSTLAPQFVVHPEREGILSVKLAAAAPIISDDVESQSLDDTLRIYTSRGAAFGLRAVIEEVGDDVLDKISRLWEAMSLPLLTKLARGEQAAKGFRYDDANRSPVVDSDKGTLPSKPDVQGIVDSLTIIQAVAEALPPTVKGKILGLLPQIVTAVTSDFSILRYNASKCLSVLCATYPLEGLPTLVTKVLPLLSDKSVVNRQGGIEAVSIAVQRLQLKILPYVLFLVVPVLGRMSDPDESVRMLATSTFADLIKMVPLEEGIPEPEGFSEEDTAKRDSERQFLMQLLDNRRVQPYEIPVHIKADLRPYQKDGVSWLAFLARYQLHGVLCDDMGLGKSLQTICIMVSKHKERKDQGLERMPSLIVCPPTLIGHWYHEILKFTDGVKPFQYYGTSIQREPMKRAMLQADVVITSYEIIRSDISLFGQVDWLYAVLDEGHAIKNGKSKLTLAAKALKATHRLVLSGTPIQNNVLELWSLFDFLMPGFLGTEKQFNERFSRPILANREGKATTKQKEAAALALEALHKQVLPFLLRRLKEDVLDDLPPKIIQDYYCDLSPVQKYLYENFANSQDNKEIEAVVKAEIEPGKGEQKHVFQTLQFLRKLCNHPLLALNLDNKKYSEVVRKVAAQSPESTSKTLLDISHAPKLEALQQILLDCGIGVDAKDDIEDLTAPRHRVLVFAQTKQMLDVVENLLFERNMPTVSYMRLDGSTDTLQRHSIVQTFNADPSIDVLLLTTAVGGLGLTLTGADTVIFLDHDWNPMKDLQAMDRAHRIGQKKVVNVYRLITKDTLEEKIMGLQRFKLNIASSVITQQNAALSTMNTDQVLDLFTVGEPAKTESSTSAPGKITQSSVLEGLEELPAEDEYENLSLNAFLSKLS